MRQRFFATIVAVMAVWCVATARDGDVPELKKAILMTYYGTLDDSARAVSFDALTARVRQTFPGVEVREAYTSRATASAMRQRSGRPHPLVVTALQQLEADGYNSIVVVSGELIEGKTARLLAQRVDTMRHHFFELKTTSPLLFSADDCRRVMQVVAREAHAAADEQVVLVCHGRNGVADAVFALCDYILQHEGYENCHVATIEGYPSMANIKEILSRSGSRRVVLVPLMMVGGGHAKRQVCTNWRQALESDGYSVRTVESGLLDHADIQQLIIDKIKEADQQP